MRWNMTVSEQFTKVGDGLLVRAPGKINISLLVKGKRADGYHDIETIMAKVDWYDEILFEKYEIRNTKYETQNTKYETGNNKFEIRNSKYETQNPKSEIPNKSAYGGQASNTEQRIQNAEQKMEDPASQSFAEAGGGQENVQYPMSNVECQSETHIELICKGEYKVPEGEENLVYKAAKIILEWHGHPGRAFTGWKPVPQIKITLTKNVPAGAGLGSGSSDAAATLLGVNKFLKLDLGKKEIWELGAKLGSDVAFFLDGPMALCTGRGEKVKKIQECEFRALLIVPDVSVSTKMVYENYRHDEAKYGRLSEEIKIYIEKKRVDLVSRMCANMLQESSFELHPELGVLKKKIESLGIRPVCLSGSGSSMYCIVDGSNEEGVMAYQKKLADNGVRSIIVKNNMW